MPLPSDIPLGSILNSIADGVFTVDQDFTVTYFNAAATKITGVAWHDAVGRKCWEVLRSSLCDCDCVLESCIRKELTLTNKSIFIVRPDGVKVPISISAAPLRDRTGTVIGGVETIRDLTEIHLIRKEVERNYSFEDIVSKSPAIQKIFQILPQVATSDATVLILGDSGTGKELFAKALHHLSNRKAQPFVAVNCGAMPDTLLESELFGYKAGAFTDARKDKPGRFQTAQGGTLFLDEIGDMPMSLQVKLLRVLQEKVFEPLGSVRSTEADVRIIAATNTDLEKQVASGRFRQDLFYRLNVVTLRLPPLAERPEDIPLLINHFIERQNRLKDKSILEVSEETLQILMRHPFPGNVRELENIIEYAFILCNGEFIQTQHLPDYLLPRASANDPPASPRTLEEIKCSAMLRSLRRNNGKRMKTCRELGITKDTLRRMIRRCEEMGYK